MNYLLPKEDITYWTNLKEAEVLKRLAERIEPEKFRFGFFTPDKGKAYEGRIDGRKFKIKRIIFYRNSFLPLIWGSIESELGATVIRVRMRLHPLVNGFFWLFLVGLAAVCIAMLFQADHVQNAHAFRKSIPFIILPIMYSMALLGFKYESSRAKRDLLAIFDANKMEEQ